MLEINELRLILKIAHLYFQENIKQQEIAKKLKVSQSYVSRAINRAQNDGLVKVSIIQPPGLYLNLEHKLQKNYQLKQVIIVDVPNNTSNTHVKSVIGTSAAHYLETVLRKNDSLGISSWSSTIAAMINSMHFSKIKAKNVIQLLGGVGTNGSSQATFLTQNLANILKATPYMLPAQSIEASYEAKKRILKDPEIINVFDSFSYLDIAIVGIGQIKPSELLQNSGNYYSQEKLIELVEKGAIGDICLHYYDINGQPILSEEEDPVVAISLSKLKEIPLVIGLACGEEKVDAIHGALMGQYCDVLITDIVTAKEILHKWC